MNTLRSCGIGGGHHLGHDSRSFNGTYFCPKHLRMYLKGFYPVANDLVWFIDGYGSTTWVVLSRAGQKVVLRKLGLPDSHTITSDILSLCPASYVHVYRNPKVAGCGV